MASRLIFRPLFIMSLFFIVAAVSNFMKLMKTEYIHSLTESDNHTATKYNFNNHHYRLKTSRGYISLDQDMAVQGSIAFINGRQKINCNPIFYMKKSNFGNVELGLDCQEETLTIFATMLLDTIMGATKSVILLLFVYLSVLYCYRDLTTRRKNADTVKDEYYYRIVLPIQKPKGYDPKLRQSLANAVLNIKELETQKLKKMGLA